MTDDELDLHFSKLFKQGTENLRAPSMKTPDCPAPATFEAGVRDGWPSVGIAAHVEGGCKYCALMTAFVREVTLAPARSIIPDDLARVTIAAARLIVQGASYLLRPISEALAFDLQPAMVRGASEEADSLIAHDLANPDLELTVTCEGTSVVVMLDGFPESSEPPAVVVLSKQGERVERAMDRSPGFAGTERLFAEFSDLPEGDSTILLVARSPL